MGKMFEFPKDIYFGGKLGAENFDDPLPINNWFEGDIKTGLVAVFFGVPTPNGHLIFRIPIDDLEIEYACNGNAQFVYRGNDEELMKTLVENADKVNDLKKPCPMELNGV